MGEAIKRRRSIVDKKVDISTLPVGTSVYCTVDGVKTELIIINQGLPYKSQGGVGTGARSDSYDSNCNNTWLMFKHLTELTTRPNQNNYPTSSNTFRKLSGVKNIYSFLNGIDGDNTYRFFQSIDIWDKILDVTLKFVVATINQTTGTLYETSPMKLFPLSLREMGYYNYIGNATDTTGYLDYFRLGQYTEEELAPRRLTTAPSGESSLSYWLRMIVDNNTVTGCARQSGADGTLWNYATAYTTELGCHPSLILPFSTKVNARTNQIIV